MDKKMKILETIKGIIFSKYLKSIVRNTLQFGFGAITGALAVVATKYGIAPEDVQSLVNAILSIKEPLEAVLVPLIGSLSVAGLSLLNAKKEK
jgi:hypothetical protein